MQTKLANRLDNGMLEASDLLEIRKYYNDILRSKDLKNASFKHLQDINANIDNALKQGLDDLEATSGIKTSKIWNDYKGINKEYAEYAKFKDSDFYKDVVKSKKERKT